MATILSAQSTDVTINKVTPKLFDTYKTAADYKNADRARLEELIKSSGFYHNKAKSIQEAARIIDEKYGGEVPPVRFKYAALTGKRHIAYCKNLCTPAAPSGRARSSFSA